MVITNAGAVGIGTITPSTRLEVNVSGAEGLNLLNTTNADSSRLFFTNSNGAGASCVIVNSNNDLRFATGGTVGSGSGTERMRIASSSGNVGIGTTTINAALSVYTAQNALATLIFGSNNGRMLGKFSANGGAGAETINLFTITSFSSPNSRVFGTVKVMWVDPVSDAGNVATAYFGASQGGTRTQGSFTTSQVWNSSTVGSLSWSGDILRLVTPAITFASCSIEVEYSAFDGASIAFDTSNQ
jgi:hypothetical protein